MQLLKMTPKSVFFALCNKKIFALIASVYLIPQAVQLVLKLTWAIFLLFLFFLMVELCVIFVIKTWYPDRINVVHVMEWTVSTILRFGRSILSVFYYLVSSVFDLVFGKAFRNQSSNSTSNAQVASRNKDASQSRPARNGYTPLAIRAMTNSANSRPNNTKRFSL